MASLKITRGFKQDADPKLEMFSNKVSLSMTGNPYFPNPIPTLADMGTLIDGFTTALIESKDGDRLKIAIKNQKRAALVTALDLWADYVVFQSEGDIVKAVSSSFKVAKIPGPQPPITKPEDFRVLNGTNPGELIAKVKRQQAVITYVYQYATDEQMAQGIWKGLPCSRATCVLSGLVPGTKYNLRVEAVGPKDQLMYSDVISRIVA